MKTLLHCFLRGQDLLVKIPLATVFILFVMSAHHGSSCHGLSDPVLERHSESRRILLEITYFKSIRKFNLTTWFSFQNTSLKILQVTKLLAVKLLYSKRYN